MVSFKSGDKVRVIDHASWANFTLKVGDIHTVAKATNGGLNVILAGDDDEIRWMSERFELVREENSMDYMTDFKVGDRFEIIDGNGNGTEPGLRGKIKNVYLASYRYNDDSQFISEAIWDDGKFHGGFYAFRAKKIEQEHTYKAGDVVIIKPNGYSGDDVAPGSVGNVLRVSENGLYLIALPNYPDGLNFFEREIQGLKPEFTHTYKVGDKLRHDFDRDGLFYTVESLLSGNEYYNVSWTNSHGERCTQPWNISDNDSVTPYIELPAVPERNRTEQQKANLDDLYNTLRKMKDEIVSDFDGYDNGTSFGFGDLRISALDAATKAVELAQYALEGGK